MLTAWVLYQSLSPVRLQEDREWPGYWSIRSRAFHKETARASEADSAGGVESESDVHIAHS